MAPARDSELVWGSASAWVSDWDLAATAAEARVTKL